MPALIDATCRRRSVTSQREAQVVGVVVDRRQVAQHLTLGPRDPDLGRREVRQSEQAMDPQGAWRPEPSGRSGASSAAGGLTSVPVHLRRFQNLRVVDGDHIHRRAHPR